MKQVLSKLIPHIYWLLVVVIIYLISMLVYVSIEFFQKSEPVKIADFGSILSGVSALFTGLVALYVFSNWKNQTIKLFLKDESKLLLYKTNSIINQIMEVGKIINGIQILEYIEHTPGNSLKVFDEIERFKIDNSKLINDLNDFSDIANDTKLKQLIDLYKVNYNNYRDFYIEIQNNSRYPYGGNFKKQEEVKRNAINESTITIKKRLVEYILLKVD